MIGPGCEPLGGLDKTLRSIGEFVEIHAHLPF